MHVDSSQSDKIRQATRHDPRVTRVGRFIRRTSIDELPQLLNVLRGGNVDCRPAPARSVDPRWRTTVPRYRQYHAARHKVKPGITGWAQVCGWRGETDTEDKLVKRVEYDLHYIEHWSVGFDLAILLRTAFAW